MILVKDLCHRYPGSANAALQQVDLCLPEGAVSGLLGPNGAGKSTLLAILTGALRRQQGEVSVAGHDPSDSKALKAISALVPQDYAFYPALTGRENLAFFAGIYRMNPARWRDRLDYVVAACSLTAVLDLRAETYSGGLKRRLNLAIGLLNAPQILYLDEPTVGIDAESRQTILQAIQTLRASGITLVYCSHYMEEVEAICDNVSVIDGGRILASGSMAEFLSRLGETGIHLYLQAPAPASLQQALAAYAPHWMSAASLHIATPNPQLVPVLLALLQQHQAQVQSLRFGASRLEDVYMRLLHAGGA